ncbi:hypothetical protein TCAL_10682 [Tigriopus californicus]|uniref:SID1 transmembrane family member 1 n=1 Tax=Tigriopus californicus TaxID=6832 RepID=A0A553PG64_TIGCA|nr:hypothetical protein TCAL_10682 [Tigriopus californicus]|eukprot:TCALIF_10682-PA protein Name:"Similar to SIDT1 SID1 transmembrane family member 1 (Homo sapiens)" AED:0.07 eAED:0.08 QI:0/0/0/0.5/1/1/2/0/739
MIAGASSTTTKSTIAMDVIHLDLNHTQEDLTLHIPSAQDHSVNIIISPNALNKNSLRIRTKSLFELSVIVNNIEGSLFWSLRPHENGTGLEKQERTMFIGQRVTVETLSSQQAICALISVQALDHRYHDEEHNIRFQNRWQTMRTFASLDVPLTGEFEDGFYIVALVLTSNSYCESQEDLWSIQSPHDQKEIEIQVYQSKEDMGLALYVTLMTFTGFFIVTLVLAAVFRLPQEDLWSIQSPHDQKEIEIQVYQSKEDMGLALYVTLMTFTGFFIVTLVLAAVFRLPLEGRLIQILQELNGEVGVYAPLSSRNEALQVQEPCEQTPLAPADKRPLTLQDLGAQLAEANSPAQAYIRSTLYCWLVFLMGLFYSLPVIQLVLANEKNILKIGNLDSCFFNYQCKFTFMGIPDFNHMLSNVSYVVFGFLFMTLTKLRKTRYRVLQEHTNKPSDTGVPEHFGIFYALGGALVMEGVLSSIYHICPSQLSLHFDTTFMYVIAVLIFLKVHQFRHPDISANAHIVFSGIGLALAVEMIGFYTTNIIFWAIFDLVYLAMVFFFTLNVYFYGRSDLLWQTLRKMGGDPRTWKPSRFGVLALLLVILVFNLAFAAQLLNNPAPTVSWNILVVLFGNMIIYILYYMGMKLYLLRYKQRLNERMSTLSLIYAGSGILFLVLAGVFFQLGTMNSELSPSESRDLNRPCSLMVFDYHDLWHMSSAFGLFLLFLMILTLEDNNFLTTWQDIQVF